MHSLKMASKSRNMSLKILKKKINEVLLDYILSLYLIISFYLIMQPTKYINYTSLIPSFDLRCIINDFHNLTQQTAHISNF